VRFAMLRLQLLRRGKPSIVPAKEDEMVVEHNFTPRAPRLPDDPGNVTDADRDALMAPARAANVVLWVMTAIVILSLCMMWFLAPAHSRPHPLDIARAGVSIVGVNP